MPDTSFRYAPPPVMDDPYADDWTRPFWDATSQEILTAPRCTNCGKFRLPPGRFCSKCLTQTFEWVELPGTGSLFSFIVVRHPLRPDDATYVPYIPAVVQADGAPGCRFTSNVVDVDPADVVCDMKLRVVWNHINDQFVLPFWTRA
jgi:uncharacterized OB-fold protein